MSHTTPVEPHRTLKVLAVLASATARYLRASGPSSNAATTAAAMLRTCWCARKHMLLVSTVTSHKLEALQAPVLEDRAIRQRKHAQKRRSAVNPSIYKPTMQLAQTKVKLHPTMPPPPDWDLRCSQTPRHHS